MRHARKITGIGGCELGGHFRFEFIIQPGLRHKVSPMEIGLVIVIPACLRLLFVG